MLLFIRAPVPGTRVHHVCTHQDRGPNKNLCSRLRRASVTRPGVAVYVHKGYGIRHPKTVVEHIVPVTKGTRVPGHPRMHIHTQKSRYPVPTGTRVLPKHLKAWTTHVDKS